VLTQISCAVGLVLAWWELGTSGAVTCWVFTTALTLCIVLTVRGSRFPCPRWLRTSLLGGLAATASVGLLVGLGLAGLAWILTLAATGRAGRWWVRRWLVAEPLLHDVGGSASAAVEPAPDPTLPGPGPSPVSLQGLDDTALCLAWRRSYLQLQQATSASGRLRHVQHRQRLLDELERRDPAGLAAWLASGCRAAGNPLPFLTRSRPAARESDPRPRDDPPR
jgi:hypothetical protein